VRTLAAGRSAILVVPDHRDQAQLEAALAGRAPADAIIRNDARQTSPARYSAFLRLLAPAPCIVIGNRSSVYAPVHDPGLIAIWDDGDPLLAEPLSPGVHARDAALIRQELDGCAVVSDLCPQITVTSRAPRESAESRSIVASNARQYRDAGDGGHCRGEPRAGPRQLCRGRSIPANRDSTWRTLGGAHTER